MPLPDPYAAGLQLAQLRDQNDQIAKVAELGAQRLEQYGDQGAQWAARLRSDPRAASAMAQEYGKKPGSTAVEGSSYTTAPASPSDRASITFVPRVRKRGVRSRDRRFPSRTLLRR